MKPRVYSQVWRDLGTSVETRRWHVTFMDSCGCGCADDVDFPTHAAALRFAWHIALGGSRWEFVA